MLLVLNLYFLGTEWYEYRLRAGTGALQPAVSKTCVESSKLAVSFSVEFEHQSSSCVFRVSMCLLENPQVGQEHLCVCVCEFDFYQPDHDNYFKHFQGQGQGQGQTLFLCERYGLMLEASILKFAAQIT